MYNISGAILAQLRGSPTIINVPPPLLQFPQDTTQTFQMSTHTEPEVDSVKTTVIPFDGQGRDPCSLIGRKIKWYYMSGKGVSLLTFKCDNGMPQFVNPGDLQDFEKSKYQYDHRSWFCLDNNLKERFSSLERNGRSSIPIVDACIARRERGSGSLYRVIGIKCEGMEDFKFISCKKQGIESRGNMFDPDDSDLEFEEYDFYIDVILASNS
jgi:hypothetical protein